MKIDSTPKYGETHSPRRLMMDPDFRGLLEANALQSLQDFLAFTGNEVLAKPGLAAWRERIRLRLDAAAGPTICYLKRFSNPPPAARREVRRSGSGAVSVAGVEWEWAHRLAADGIPCVQAVALGEEFHRGREVRSALLTLAVPGESLERLAQRWGPQDRPTIRRLLLEVAALVAQFHALGYVHRDLYLSHIFFDEADRATPGLRLIDLQRVLRPRYFKRRWIIKDLASLNFSAPREWISRADRLRWLKNYLAIRKLNPDAKCLALRVIGKTLAIARHERQRQERIQKGVNR